MLPSIRLTVSIDAHWWHLLTTKQISNAQFNLIQVLTNYRDPNDGWCRLTAKQMASILGLKSIANVQKCLTDLEQAGHLKKKTKKRTEVWRQLVVRSIPQKYTPNDGVYLGQNAPPLIYPPLESFSLKLKRLPSAASPPSEEEGDSMLFEELEETAQATIPEEAYITPAKKLYQALSTIPDRTPKRNAWKRWVDDFRKLHELDGISLDRINATMDWLVTPEQIKRTAARSGARFRQMFTDLESYMDAGARPASKQKPATPELDPKLKKRAEALHSGCYWNKRISLEEVEYLVYKLDQIDTNFITRLAKLNVKYSQSYQILHERFQSRVVRADLLRGIVEPLVKWDKWNGKITKQIDDNMALLPNTYFRRYLKKFGIHESTLAVLEKVMTCED